MRLPASLFLGLRYMRPKRSIVTAIPILSILGPIVGVAVLIVVIAVMAGFGRDIRSRLFGMQSHIQLMDARGKYIENPEPLIEALRAKGLRASPTTEGPVLVQVKREISAKMVRGIHPETDREVTIISKHIIAGKYEVGDGEALVGSDFAMSFGIWLGDTIAVHATGKLEKMVKFDDNDQVTIEKTPDEVYLPEELKIVGIYSVGMYDFDDKYIITNLDTADDLMDIPWGGAQTIQVLTDDAFNLQPVVNLLGSDPVFVGMRYTTWMQANRQMEGALRVEKTMQFFLLSIIVVVAGFCIAAMLIGIVVQKTHEIGVLKAMGATPLTILGVFVYQGAVVGLLGVGLGTTLGLLIVKYRNDIAKWLEHQLHVEVFPKGLYQLAEIPAYVERSDLLIIAVTTFLICILAAAIPALYAACLTPSNALRNDSN